MVKHAARDQILGHISTHFKGHALARLVEAVLQAQGYVTRKSEPGPDGGVDILAGAGPMGFDQPKLCVQVKSSDCPADVNVLRGLQGTMGNFGAQQGLLVSWGGFTRPTWEEARRNFFVVRLWDPVGQVRRQRVHQCASLPRPRRSQYAGVSGGTAKRRTLFL